MIKETFPTFLISSYRWVVENKSNLNVDQFKLRDFRWVCWSTWQSGLAWNNKINPLATQSLQNISFYRALEHLNKTTQKKFWGKIQQENTIKHSWGIRQKITQFFCNINVFFTDLISAEFDREICLFDSRRWKEFRWIFEWVLLTFLGVF